MLTYAEVRQHGLHRQLILQGPHQTGDFPSALLTHRHHLEAKGFGNPCLFAAHRLLDGIDSLLGVAALCILLLDVLDRLQGVLSCARVRINNSRHL